MRYEIEYIKRPQYAIGLPACMKWNVYKVVGGNYYHQEGFRLKREAKAYIKEVSK